MTKSSNETVEDETLTAEQPEMGDATPTSTEETQEDEPKQHTSVEDANKELAKVRKALKKANEEAASHRIKARELDELKKQAENEKLSETERLQKELKDLQSKHDSVSKKAQERIVNAEVRLQANSLGIINPSVAAKLLDRNEFEFDDEGEPTNIASLLKALIKENPYLIASKTSSAPQPGSTTNPSRSSTTAPKELSREVLAAMKPEEYNARRAEIQAWMKKNPHRFGQ